MVSRILCLSCLLALMPGVAPHAYGEATAQTAALLANWPDGASGNVAITELDSEVHRAYHVTRRGSRLTIFDRSDRQYRTYYLSRSGSVVTVWDSGSATRTAYVMRGRRGIVSPIGEPGNTDLRAGLRSTVPLESEPSRAVASTELPRLPSSSSQARYRIRPLDRIITGANQPMTAIDIAILSIITDP